MTPPSRVSTGGSSTTARLSKSLLTSRAADFKVCAKRCNPGESSRSNSASNSGISAMLSRKVERSRGRALFKATRAKIRSTSPTCFSNPRRRSNWRVSSNVSTACERSRNTCCARSGCPNQRLSKRAPIGTTQVSNKPASVCSSRPFGCSNSSKLRRVAASSASTSALFSTLMLFKCGNAARWVSCT